MGSFKRNGQDQGPDRRRNDRGHRRLGHPSIETLEGRVLLTGGPPWKPTSTNLADVKNGPMGNEGQDLINVYQTFQNNGGDAAAVAAKYPLLQFSGDKVSVGVTSNGGDLNTFVLALHNLGFQVTAVSSTYNLVSGNAPISQLPAVAALPQTLSAAPNYRPVNRFVGAANNEAERSLNADVARATYGVDGTGVTVGVISDSVSVRAGGLADSVKTGDLPAGVQNLKEGPAGSTDEGRAMLENIHDIAPGAGLAFASGAFSDVGFADSVRLLANQGNAKVIVDDLGYANEPFFQDGVIQQAVNEVTATKNVTYLSAAGNSGPGNGYLSGFRSATGTVTGVGAGTFMNFATAGAPVLQIPVTTNQAGVSVIFQYDQPFTTQQPAGSTAQVTSDLDIFVLDASGNIVASGTNNNVATQQPFEFLTIPNAGAYTIAVQLKAGTAPGHLEFVSFSQGANPLVVSQALGNATQGVYYPSTYGKSAGNNTVGVGAVPWWASTPYLGTSPLKSEPFSSSGPALFTLNPDGTPKSGNVAPTLNPFVSGPDGGNTSFFEGPPIDTSKPPFPGEPATTTNLSQNLPSFFGTSSSSPNVAAVVALMRQRVPNLTLPQVEAGLQSGARALNGSTSGTYDFQGGYGLVDASAAIAAVDVLRVASTTPGNGTTVTTTPTQILVTFSKPINLATFTTANLAFQSVPSNVTSLFLGTPVGVDDPKFPTTVAIPFSFNVAPNSLGNGRFSYIVQGAVTSKDGKLLTPYASSFNLADTVSPRVANTTVSGRTVTVQFNEAVAPSSVRLDTIWVERRDANGTFQFNLNSDPRARISYNPATLTATLDYSGLDQSQLTNANYYIIVRGGNAVSPPTNPPTFEPGVTDVVGNKLDGEFTGVFPSGEGDPTSVTNPTGRSANENFVQALGNLGLTAPVITSFNLIDASDTGVKGDSNTNLSTPVFIGQVAAGFPGTVAGLKVFAEFNALHGGNLDLAPLNGRGTTGSYDVQVTTDANGTFRLPAPFLPEGFHLVRLVVVGQADAPPLPGLSSAFNKSFKIDQTPPLVIAATLTPGSAPLPMGNATTSVNTLTALSLDVVDGNNPNLGPLATPVPVLYPAVNPFSASNISNYKLLNVSSTGVVVDYSRLISTAQFVATSSDFVSPANRTSTSDPYFGRIDLTFTQGLPRGHYVFAVLTQDGSFTGLTDTAGNPLDDSTVSGQGSKNFYLNLDVQPEPVYIASVSANASNASGNTLLPRAYYEINPRAGDVAVAPPTVFNVDFSNPLDSSKSYNDAVQLIASANGDFGTLGVAGTGSGGTGFARFNPAGTTVSLANGPYGTNTRLVLTLPAGTTLPANHYRLYVPNSGATAINDIYNNHLDGEFLGNPATTGNDLNSNPAYEDLLPTGQYRNGMSGDGVAGGAFMTGFVVVPSGNLIYARPDYVEDSNLPSTASDGSLAKPYSVLAPQAAPNALNSSTLNNGDPNGGLNSAANFLSGFNAQYDRAGIGRFARSAFYAAQQLSSRGPVVIVALPGTSQRDPNTGVISQRTFVLQAPSGSDPVINDGSASVPFDTSLVFNPGSTLKLQNASLFVQNQGSSLLALGGVNPNDRVTFTSYSDDGIAGDTNNNGTNTVPRGGDWGGIVFRNFNQAGPGRTNTFPIDVTLAGPNGSKAVSGADDSLSSINFARVLYGGGAVPATQGTRYDEITLYNSRPAITNTSLNGGGSSSQATISGDLDSFREDDTARGPLIRRTTVANASLNGIWVRPLTNVGVAEATDAIAYPPNPVTLGGAVNYTFDSPLPYILTSTLDIGNQNVTTTPGQNNSVHSRLYIQPGMMVKSEPGGGVRVLNPGSSLIVGDRTYISRWDAKASISPDDGLPTSTYGPLDADFKPNTTGDAHVLFTSALDNTATTSYFDPIAQTTTVIVPAIDALGTGGAGQPAPGAVPDASRWGRIVLNSGSFGTLDEADIRYGGGSLNVPGGSNGDAGVVQFAGAGGGGFFFDPSTGTFQFVVAGHGTRYSVTNNLITDNADAPMSNTPNGLLAADTLRPLASGHPFYRGNIFQRNIGGNGLLIEGTNNGSRQVSNVDVNSLWDSTDLTYMVRNSIVMGGFSFFNPGGGVGGTGPTAFQAEAKPSVVLTVQSALAGTLLANGASIPRPGESVVVKLDPRFGQTGPSEAFTTGANVSMEDSAGPGFVAGVDNGVDPAGDPYLDVGVFSQMRFLGIGGNETTGQQRVPAVVTSIYDNTVGSTVRGVRQFNAIDGSTTAPKAGDGGLIYFGGNERTDYNVLDPRDGSLIDNADIRYISRIEMQGGGVINYIDLNASNSFDIADQPGSQKAGVFPPLANGQPDPRSFQVQANGEHAMTISSSNLSNFRDYGILVHPGFNQLALGAGTPRSGIAGEPNMLFMMNNTISNMPTAIKVIGDPNSDSSNAPVPSEVLLLNNTFYNNPLLAYLQAIEYNPGTPQISAQIHLIAMDNIISGSTTGVIQSQGMVDGSIFQYNLFFNSGAFQTQIPGGPAQVGIPNDFPIFGDPQFRDPTNGNFQLQPTSPAIDAARSELNLNPDTAPTRVGNYANHSATLLPIVNQVLDARGGIRSQTARVALGGFFFGGGGLQLDPNNPPTDQLTLPGSPNRGFVDLWYATPSTDPLGVPGPTTVPGTWLYKPALIPAGTQGVPGGGQRDALGYLRIDAPNRPNVGFGSLPFFDIGAFEYRPLFPPHVTSVTATVTDPATATGVSTVNLYTVGGVSGTNKPLQTINVGFDLLIDPNTLTGSTVLLQASGGDAIFGNNNSANDKFYNLSGKLTFDPATKTLTINVGAAGLTLGNDEYRLFILGSGSDVVRDQQGNALDGENTLNDDPNNPQLPLPSGDGFPGGNFFTTFVINTQAPTIVAGSLKPDSSTDSNVVGDFITNNNKPAFSGQVAVAASAIQPLAGQTVVLDVSTRGDGVFDRLNAGTALTNANGTFLVKVGTDGALTGLVTDTSGLPDSPYNVGANGIESLASSTFTGSTYFRVRIIDQAGNSSNAVTDPVGSYIANGAFTVSVIDTASPKITSFTPSPNSKLTTDPLTGKLNFAFTTDSNVDPKSLTANSIFLTRAGADGVLGTADDVAVPIDAASIKVTYLGGGKGPQAVSFSAGGTLPNDQYAVTLLGTGATPVIDPAGNALAGRYTGTFPSGADNAPGDFNPVYVVFNSSNLKVRFVGDQFTYQTDPTAAVGTRNNPYPTITKALAAAAAGDTIGVLPGVYTEKISLKPFVKIYSSSTKSTDKSFTMGNAQATVLRAPANTSATAANVTVTAVNLPTVPGVDTEIAGITIASPLSGDPATGTIDPQSIGVLVVNSNVAIDRSYVVDAQTGIEVVTAGANAATPRIFDSGIVGNVVGTLFLDSGTTSLTSFTTFINNTVAFNTIGALAQVTSTSPVVAFLGNNIFWQNHANTAARGGAGIVANSQNKIIVRSNMFSGNGASDTNSLYAGIGIGGSFNASALKATPDASGNFVGIPSFVAPRDPRPDGDGPAIFFLDGNFATTSRSLAIDAGDNTIAPFYDFLTKTRVDTPGKGFPGTGPADVGAFEFNGAGVTAAGGAFRVATTSLSAEGGARANGASVSSAAPPANVTVAFSDSVDPSTVSVTDLILSGDGVNSSSPAKATSLSWVDDHTVQFNLSKGFNPTGTVNVLIPVGAVKSINHAPNLQYSDSIKLVAASTLAPAVAVATAPAATPAAAPTTPAPAASPRGPARRGAFHRLPKRKA